LLVIFINALEVRRLRTRAIAQRTATSHWASGQATVLCRECPGASDCPHQPADHLVPWRSSSSSKNAGQLGPKLWLVNPLGARQLRKRCVLTNFMLKGRMERDRERKRNKERRKEEGWNIERENMYI